MSELIDNAQERRELLKHLILQLHKGEAPEAVRKQLARLMGTVPYETVVKVEQELVDDGLPAEEILELCDLHSAVLKGHIDQEGAKEVPPAHPVHTFREENRILKWETEHLNKILDKAIEESDEEKLSGRLDEVRLHLNSLADVDKHYARKENLLFPFLEKYDITGPPKVMWGKDDETRELLRAAIEASAHLKDADNEELKTTVEMVLRPALEAIDEMIYKEEEILLPMALDTLKEEDWYEIYKQSLEIGFCLYDPSEEWRPEHVSEDKKRADVDTERIQLPSGSLTVDELNAILNNIPFDLTLVDKDDTVRYFTQGRERIFSRNRAILGRKVQMCHPPSSVHIVQQILDDFRSGKESRAPFWIELKGKFIHIEYFALRDKNGEYLGTLEVSQDLTEKRKLHGEQRLLSYSRE